MNRRRSAAALGAATLVFAGLTAVATVPRSGPLGDHVVHLGDPLHIAWILSWNVHALTTAPTRLFHANTIYPLDNTLALSEHLLGVVPLFAVPYALTGNEILALNVVVLLSFVLSGVAMFVLVRHLTASAWAGLLAGVVFAFAPIRTGHIDHAQLMQFYWTPFTLLCLERFIMTRRRLDLAGFAGCWTLQCLSSVYLALLSMVVVVVYGLVRLVADRAARERRLALRLGAASLAVAVVVALVHLPYVDVQRRWLAAWPQEWVVGFSASPLDYVGGRLVEGIVGRMGSDVYPWEKRVWLGVAVALLLVAAVALRRARPVPSSAALWTLLVVAFVLSLGPVLVLADRPTGLVLPHTWLSATVPGFSAMRVPARFGLVVALAAAAIAGLGACRLATWLSARGSLPPRLAAPVVALVFSAAFLVETWRPLTFAAYVDRRERAVDIWLAAHPHAGPIVEVPRGQFEEYAYTYYSTRHWRRLLNGVTSFVPLAWWRILQYVDQLPAADAAGVLAALGVREVVVHRAALKDEVRARWEPEDVRAAGLVELARFDEDVVYRLPAVPAVPGRVALDATVIRSMRRWAAVRLALAGIGPGPWVHPRPFGRTPVVGRWSCDGKEPGGEEMVGHVILPLVIEEGRTETLVVRARRPQHESECTLTLGLSALRLAAPPVAVRRYTPHTTVR